MTIVADPIPATLPEVAPLAPVVGVMPDTLAVVVRPEHIAYGRRGRATGCAFALALEDQGYRAVVGHDVAFINGARYALGPALKRWICCFDNGGPVPPERFVLHRAFDLRKA